MLKRGLTAIDKWIASFLLAFLGLIILTPIVLKTTDTESAPLWSLFARFIVLLLVIRAVLW